MNNLTAVMADFAAYQAERDTRVSEQLADLKTALIPLLRKVAIARVEVVFDGSGDSGAVEELLCFNSADDAVPFPDTAFVLPKSDQSDAGASYAPDACSCARTADLPSARTPSSGVGEQ